MVDYTPILGRPKVAGELGWKDTLGASQEDIEEATQRPVDVDCASPDTAGEIVVSAATYTGNFALRLTGSPSADFTLLVPAGDRFFAVLNETGKTATIRAVGGPTSVFSVASGFNALIVADDTDLSLMANFAAGGGEGGTIYDFGCAFGSTPTGETVITRVRIGRAITIPADMAGSAGGVGTNPTATYDIDVQDDGVSIGTISVSTGGVATFSTSGGTAKSVAAGSEITFVAPAEPTGGETIADASFVVLATVT